MRSAFVKVLEELDEEETVRAAAPAMPPAAGLARPRFPPPDERALELCEGVIDICSALFNVSGRDLRRPGRSSLDVARVRQIAMYVAHVVLRLNMADIGRAFGRDRTTVGHSCHVIEDLRDDPDFEGIVSMVERVALAAFRYRLGL